MGKDSGPDPYATCNEFVQAYDCLTQLALPLALAKMAAIAAMSGLRRNILETFARLTGGEYTHTSDSVSTDNWSGVIPTADATDHSLIDRESKIILFSVFAVAPAEKPSSASLLIQTNLPRL